MNIAEKLQKFITYFIILFAISACNETKMISNTQETPTKIPNVAILLPISGPEGELGKELVSMVKMGLAHGANSKIKVSTYDSGAPEILQDSIKKILESDTDIVIGPLYSASVKALSFRAKEKGIVLLSLSNNPALADTGVYVTGHAPMRQMQLITNELLNNNYYHYITLMPEGHYAKTVVRIVQSAVERKSGSLAKVIFYKNNPESIRQSVKTAANIADALNLDQIGHKPVIIMADDPKTTAKVLNEAVQFDLDKKALIAGDGRVNVLTQNPALVTFTGSANLYRSNIPNSAKKLGINQVSFLHAVAYDAGKLASSAMGDEYNKQIFTERLNSTRGFKGVSGNISFADTIATRKYDIMQRFKGQNGYAYRLILDAKEEKKD